MVEPEIPSLVKLLIDCAVDEWRKWHRVRARAFAQSAIMAWRDQGASNG